MEKWADYLISAVQFNPERTHINKLKIAPDDGDGVGAFLIYERQRIVSAIKSGTTFSTIYKNGNEKWIKGKDVIVVEINEVEYLKTIADDKLVDNLDNLPEF